MRWSPYSSTLLLLLLITATTTTINASMIPTPSTTPTTTTYTTRTPTSATTYAATFTKNSLPYQFIAPQNAARATLRLPPLIWDPKLASYAQWWANQRRWDCALEHSNGPYGENIFWGSSTAFSPYEAARDWISEKKNYNYWYNSCAPGEECGHYTQIVWRMSRRIGCARAACYYGQGVFMICNYDPPGNYIGQKPY